MSNLSSSYQRLVDLKTASAGTIANHIGRADTPRYRRKLAAELVRRINMERTRRERLHRRLSAALMVEFRLDRK